MSTRDNVVESALAVVAHHEDVDGEFTRERKWTTAELIRELTNEILDLGAENGHGEEETRERLLQAALWLEFGDEEAS